MKVLKFFHSHQFSGSQTARQNLNPLAVLVAFQVLPASVLVATTVHVERLVEL
jgi:hypothetical protein